MIRYTLPFPISVNAYYRNVRIGKGCRTLISQRGRAYRADVAAAVLMQGPPAEPLAGRLAVRVELHAPTRRAFDLDNTAKALHDSLEHARVFVDDAQIDRLEIVRGEVRKGNACAVVTIKEQGAA